VAASTVLAAESPLIINDVGTGEASHVRLTNTSRQPVTAWSLAATTPTTNGTHREVYTTDGYLSEVTHGLPKAAERLERLMPGESRDLPLDPLPAGAKVDVIATVMIVRTRKRRFHGRIVDPDGGVSSSPKEAHCSSTKSAICLCRCR